MSYIACPFCGGGVPGSPCQCNTALPRPLTIDTMPTKNPDLHLALPPEAGTRLSLADATQRIARLERMVAKLANAIIRRGGEQDGNWGWPAFEDEMQEIQDALNGE